MKIVDDELTATAAAMSETVVGVGAVTVARLRHAAKMVRAAKTHAAFADNRAAERLRDALFPGLVAELLHEERRESGRSGLALRLRTSDLELQHLPWEYTAVGPPPEGQERRGVGRRAYDFLFRRHDLLLIRQLADGYEPPAALPAEIAVVTATETASQYPLPEGGHLDLQDARVWGTRFDARINEALEETAITARAYNEVPTSLAGPVFAWCFFGHHVFQAGGLILPRDDGFTAVAADELARRLVSAGVKVAVIAACDTAVADEGELNLGSFASRLVQGGVPVVVAMQGAAKGADAVDFTAAFFRELALRGDAALAFRAARDAMAPGSQQVPALFTGVASLQVLRARPDPGVSRPGWEAYWLPPHWIPGAEDGPSDQRRGRIDTLWCLDRTAFTGVLADAPGADLAAALNTVEKRIAAAMRTLGLPERRWSTLDVGQVAPDRAAIEEALSYDHQWNAFRGYDDAVAGIVVALHSSDAHSPLDSLARYAEELRRTVPGTAVLYHVQAGVPVTAMILADRLGNRLGRQGPCSVLVRTAVPVPRVEPANPGAGGSLLVALRAECGRRLRALGLAEPALALDPGGPPLPKMPAVDLALAVVPGIDALQAPEAARLLRLIRDLMPEAHTEMQRACASRGPTTAGFAALAVATDRDADLAEWLESTPGTAVAEPRRAPRSLFGADHMDTIGLRLQVLGHPLAADWLAAGSGRFRDLASPIDPAGALSSYPAKSAVPVVRAARLRADDFPDPLDTVSAAFLAAVSVTEPSPSLVERLGRLPDAVRCLLGMDDGHGLDPTAAEHVLQLHQTIQPYERHGGASDAR
ncbi:CHAT domain-containing protein [Actinomadura fibrosa]|uniref:CHAT domain-containing protein n=1 Tax=Actinomadura fibrosa TaxID=111802 RepID=A0ABW2Y174_9ACTN|nr:CHAT domain-containing protein [Actinomadura fibrosa]